ncbi:acyl-CoA dehydrogenase family protein [Sphingomonas profundi]|uniref:acyl-CoA dehydrogenase family protein n=1 Tax=Alterirhizorhabdus profundi TaxID=2681549 RepID=UPI0012E6F6B3|nr:acyl-CoA dehydrogenase family protein [Sphingomonas profundi]
MSASPAPLSSFAPVGADMLRARARAIAPAIGARWDEAEALRDIPAASIAALREAGLTRLFQPQRWGGHEADPTTFFDVQNIVAAQCASTAWVLGVLNVQSLVLALFDDRAQAAVWGQDPAALVSSSFMPVGKVAAAAGGYTLSGRWSFSSGASHAGWALLGGRTPHPDTGAAELRIFLVPRGDYAILDVWNPFGMRATGSNDIVANGIFVPEWRTRTLDPGLLNVLKIHRPGPALYRLPWLYLFSAGIANFAIGTARGALDAFLDRAASRVSAWSGQVSREDPATVAAAARLDAEIDLVEASFRRNVAILQDHVARDVVIGQGEAMRLRVQLTSSVRRLAALVDDFMMLLGARGIDRSSPVTRAWLDLCAARAHPGNDPAASLAGSGAAMIGCRGQA